MTERQKLLATLTELGFRGYLTAWLRGQSMNAIHEVVDDIKRAIDAAVVNAGRGEAMKRDPRQHPKVGDVLAWELDGRERVVAVVTYTYTGAGTEHRHLHFTTVEVNGNVALDAAPLETWRESRQIKNADVLFAAE